jgi:hypothetical protein
LGLNGADRHPFIGIESVQLLACRAGTIAKYTQVLPVVDANLHGWRESLLALLITEKVGGIPRGFVHAPPFNILERPVQKLQILLGN